MARKTVKRDATKESDIGSIPANIMYFAEERAKKDAQPRHNDGLHQIIRNIRKKYPDMSLRGICEVLAKAGVTTKSGGPLNTSYITYVLGRNSEK